MNDILFTPLRLTELETLIEKSFERVLSKVKTQTQQPESQSDLIFLNEVCKLTNLRKATIYSLVTQGKIPYLKPSGTKKLMFSKVVILEWLQNGRPSIAEQQVNNSK